MLNGHGNDKYNYRQEIKADFSSNAWFQPLPDEFFELLSLKLKNVSDYPDPYCSELRGLIANNQALSPENVLVTNGSTEAIYLVAQAFAGKISTIIYPGFRSTKIRAGCITVN